MYRNPIKKTYTYNCIFFKYSEQKVLKWEPKTIKAKPFRKSFRDFLHVSIANSDLFVLTIRTINPTRIRTIK